MGRQNTQHASSCRRLLMPVELGTPVSHLSQLPNHAIALVSNQPLDLVVA